MWIRLLVGAFLVNVAVFALPQSIAVVFLGAVAYPLVQWAMRRNLLPSFDLASGTGPLVASCCLSAVQAVLLAATDLGYAVYFLRENSSYLIWLVGTYVAATAVGAALGWAFRVRWLVVPCFSLVMLFLTNAYVFTLLLLPLLLGYALGARAPTSRARLVLLVSNAVLIALFYSFMSVFTLSGVEFRIRLVNHGASTEIEEPFLADHNTKRHVPHSMCHPICENPAQLTDRRLAEAHTSKATFNSSGSTTKSFLFKNR